MIVGATGDIRLPDGRTLQEAERERILAKAESLAREKPRTVTAVENPRSAGGPQDFSSDSDYWWPDPENPRGPYIRRDGESNPNNFNEHRHLLMRLHEIVATRACAWVLTGDDAHAQAATEHLLAWFVNPDTRMNPSLPFAQAIQGRETGRSFGIIDTLHLTEVAMAVEVLSRGDKSVAGSIRDALRPVRAWFADYLEWLDTHELGRTERDFSNNHGVCWWVQACAFARAAGHRELLPRARERFERVFLAQMMDERGGFPAELARTKPYGYSLFVLDALTAVALLASEPGHDLFTLETGPAEGKPKGPRSFALGVRFLLPATADKSNWAFDKDVQHWDDWPSRHPFLLCAWHRLADEETGRKAGEIWSSQQPDPQVFEVRRNLPLRHPLLWPITSA